LVSFFYHLTLFENCSSDNVGQLLFAALRCAAHRQASGTAKSSWELTIAAEREKERRKNKDRQSSIKNVKNFTTMENFQSSPGASFTMLT
jgi:hypothetical protein